MTATPWLPYGLRRPHADVRLICLPYAGGTASMYWHWLDALPEFVEACPVQYPGRTSRIAERSYDEMPALLDALAPAVQDLLDRPYAIFGHSLGALVAYELCHKLVAGGAAPPVRLFVAGHAAPHLPRPRPPVHHLPDDGFLAELNRLGGTPPEVLADKQLLRLILPALRADYRIAERYRWSNRPALPVPITVFGGLADPDAPPAALRTWRQHTSATVSVSLYPGGHFFLHNADAGLHHRIADHLDSTKPIAPSPGAADALSGSRSEVFARRVDSNVLIDRSMRFTGTTRPSVMSSDLHQPR